jgi:ferric-dicitrate binding protein FerR (iron transport regulator)
MKRPAELDDFDRKPRQTANGWVVTESDGTQRPATPAETRAAEQAFARMDRMMDRVDSLTEDLFRQSSGALPPLPPPIDWSRPSDPLQGRTPASRRYSEKVASYALVGMALGLFWIWVVQGIATMGRR